MKSAPPAVSAATATRDLYAYFALACGNTWLLTAPAARAWGRHESPPPYAMACAGLSAFGPLLAALAVAGLRHQLGQVFGRWRAPPFWILLALLAPILVHGIATALFVAVGGQPAQWFHPPTTPESVVALVVFPLGEEFGWRGFAQPRMAARFGPVRGSLIVGAVWGLWHLVYSVTPQKAGFDTFAFGLLLIELPLYALLMAWVFARAHQSMAVALAFHVGFHLDRIEQAPRTDPRLHITHVIVLAAIAALAARSLSRRRADQPAQR